MKKKTIIILTLLIVIVLISGCGLKSPSPQDLANAYYGPFPDNYENIVKTFMQTQLFDPFTAVYNFEGSPTKAWQNNFGNIFYGYGGIVGINAKNRLGGYTGFKRHIYIIKYGQVIHFQ